MGKSLDEMGAIELDAFGDKCGLHRFVSGIQVEPDRDYRERLRPFSQGNEPAFPQSESVGDVSITHGGMSLRDYFAAKAMQAIVTNDEMIKRLDRSECYKGITSGICIAKEAYMLADFLLAERAK